MRAWHICLVALIVFVVAWWPGARPDDHARVPREVLARVEGQAPLDSRPGRARTGVEAALRIRDEDGAPISDASVVARSEYLEFARARSDPDGRARLPWGGLALIRVEREGFVPWTGIVKNDDDSAVVALRRPASLQIDFVSEAGEPVGGIGTELLVDGQEHPGPEAPSLPRSFAPLVQTLLDPAPVPPSDEGSAVVRLARILCRRENADARVVEISPFLAIDPAQISTTNGSVSWSVLPSRSSMRWGVTSGHGVEVEPRAPADARGGTETGRFMSGAPGTVSAAFTLEPGERRRYLCLAHTATRVLGRVLSHGQPPSRACVVKLFDVEKQTAPDGTWILDVRQEAERGTDADGSFVFVGVRPGRKVLRGWWRDGDDLNFVGTGFTLEPTETKDLGVLEVGESAVVECEVRLRDLAGGDVPRALVANSDVGALVALSGMGDDVSPVGAAFHVEVERVVRLHGLSPGKWRLSAGPPVTWPDLKDTWRGVERDSESTFVTPGAGTQRLVLTVCKAGWLKLRCHFPVDTRFAATATLIPSTGGLSSRFNIPRRDAAEAVIEQEVFAGPYTILISPAQIDPATADVNWFALRDVVVAPGGRTECDTVFERGVEVTGVVRTTDDRPAARSIVALSAVGFDEAARPTWPYQVLTDGEGRYRIAGLIPHATFRVRTSEQVISTGAAGGAQSIDLRLRPRGIVPVGNRR